MTSIIHYSLELFALVFAAFLYFLFHGYLTSIFNNMHRMLEERLWPSGINMYFVFASGHPASHVEIGNGRGRKRLTDDRGCLGNVPRAWLVEGHQICVLLPDRTVWIPIKLSSTGEPLPIEIPIAAVNTRRDEFEVPKTQSPIMAMKSAEVLGQE